MKHIFLTTSILLVSIFFTGCGGNGSKKGDENQTDPSTVPISSPTPLVEERPSFSPTSLPSVIPSSLIMPSSTSSPIPLPSSISGQDGYYPTSTPSRKTELQGKAQKGPFVKGAVVKLFKLDSDYERTSTKVETKIEDNGNYSFSNIPWSGLSELEVSGFFLNENTGLSNEKATVTSIVDVKNRQISHTNINVLTHIASGQVRELLKKGQSLKEANKKVTKELLDIVGKVGLGVNDFGDLDILDIVGSNATANSELLVLSSALLHSTSYKSDLEALLLAYKKGGVENLMRSAIYKKLMGNYRHVDFLTIKSSLGLNVTATEITLPKRVTIIKTFQKNILNVKLYGTKFKTYSPNISVTTTEGEINLGEKRFSDDNQSVDINISGAVGECLNNEFYITIEASNLEDVTLDLKSNTINTHSSYLKCVPIEDENEGDETEKVVVPENESPVAIIGMIDNSVDGQQPRQTINTYVGVIVSGLDTYYSYDPVGYPFDYIAHCEWKDENGAVIKSSDDEYCGIYDKIFTEAGSYEYNLTVTDNSGLTNSSSVIINVNENKVPVITLSPNSEQEVSPNSLVEINATVVDADEDSLTYSWKYTKEGTNIIHLVGSTDTFSQTFTEIGKYNITFTATDSHNAFSSKTVTVIVKNSTDEYPVAIIEDSNMSVNKEVYVGQSFFVSFFGTDDIGVKYCKLEDKDGNILMEKNISPAVTAIYYDDCQYSFPIATEVGSFIYKFSIKDTLDQIDSNDLNITVLPNDIPTADIGGDRTIELGTTLTIEANITHDDIDNDMSYQWEYGVKDSGVIYSGGSSLNFSHQFNDVGLYRVSFEVKDTHNAKSLTEIDINVTTKTLTEDIVLKGNLMWEDTPHTRDGKVNNWNGAKDYCTILTLGGFLDWRLANRDEINSIMAGSFRDDSQSAIVDGFEQFYPSAKVTSWLVTPNGTTEHFMAWFTGGQGNIDGLNSNEANGSVRCVRDN